MHIVRCGVIGEVEGHERLKAGSFWNMLHDLVLVFNCLLGRCDRWNKIGHDDCSSKLSAGEGHCQRESLLLPKVHMPVIRLCDGKLFRLLCAAADLAG